MLQILKMEHLILKVLKFDMGGVTAVSFYQRYIKLTNADDNVKFLAMVTVPPSSPPPPPPPPLGHAATAVIVEDGEI